MDLALPHDATQLQQRDRAAQLTMFELFVRAAVGITLLFGGVTLTLGVAYQDGRRLLMCALLFSYAGALLLLRRRARRGAVGEAAFATALVTLVGTVSLALLHPGIHSALVLATLFPAAVALHFARGRAQWTLMALSWIATVGVGLAAEYVTPARLVPDAVQLPFRLLSIGAASGVFVLLLRTHANRLFDRVDEARAGQAAAAAATAALAAEHERLSVTLASIGEAVVVTDAVGRVTLMNRLAERVAGGDMHGRLMTDFYWLEDSRGRPLDPIAEVVGGGRTLKADDPLTLVRPDGERFLVDGSAAPIKTAAGEVIGSVIVLRDVSERTRLEEELREAQKLDAIGRLAGGVAHDFNNQLTSILGYTELLVWTFDAADPRRQDLEEIRKAADRAALVTQQLLAFSQRQILQPRVVHVPDVVMRSVRLMHRMLPRHITVTAAVDGALDPVFIDPHQLGHALLNLAVTARDTMPDGGAIRIRMAMADAARRDPPPDGPPLEPGAWVRLVLEDTGRGIPADRLPRVFEPFADQTPHSPGSLELAVVHGIVKQSGGRIHVGSAAGRGTTFTLDFPAVAHAAAEAAAADLPEGGHERILLVEDNAAVRALLSSTLERQGYAVVAPADPASALSVMPRPCHALVVDLGLPDGAGEKLAAAAVDACPGLTVIYMAGATGLRTELAAPPRGRVLQKPFTPRDLLVTLRDTLGRARPAARRTGA